MSQIDKQIIGLASDHAGYELKTYIIDYLGKSKMEYIDFGTNGLESVDYPDYAHLLAEAIESGKCTSGIAVCSTGNGISIALNRHHGIRAALCWAPELARLSRAHNNANVLTLPGNFVDKDAAIEILKVFLSTDFEGGRHQRRVDKIELC